jgi:hypothetical protein
MMSAFSWTLGEGESFALMYVSPFILIPAAFLMIPLYRDWRSN